MKKFFTLIVLCVFSIGTIHAKITWSLSDDGTLTISGTNMPDYEYHGAPWYSKLEKIKKVVINDGVTNIGARAFYNCSGLTSITIPNSVTSIGGAAFCDCSSLTSVTIPNSVTSIGAKAFERCTGLTSITIPNSVTSIEEYTFKNCSSITSITIPNSVTSIGEDAFYNCSSLTSVNITDLVSWCKINFNNYASNPFYYAKHLYLNGNEVKKLVIPNGITNIKYLAFSGCSSLTSITIPNSVTSIGSDAFSGCSGLTSINIPNSVTSIGYRAFRGCSGLTSITIPNSVNEIRDYAFYECSGLTSITIPNSVTSIEEGVFARCSRLTSVTIPNSVTSIGKEAFSSCRGLTSVTIPNSVTSIRGRAFQYCSGLTSITIPNSVTNIEDYAFNDCSGLTSISIGVVFQGIKERFKGCSRITSITLLDGVKCIVDNAFKDWSIFTSIAIPKSVTSIGYNAFYGCSGLSSITIPNSVTNIGENAFEGTKWYNSQPDGLVYAGLLLYKYKGTMPANADINIKKGTKGIVTKAFYNCSGLSSITIPNSVTSIENDAFYGCNGLTSVNITDLVSWCKINFNNYESNPLYYAKHLYLNGNEVENLVIPNEITRINNLAFYGCSGLTSVTIPNSVTSIGERSFYDCYNLQSIIIANSTPPSCSGKTTFCCSTENVRNIYDVYNYATLHVPMGSMDVYSSASEWRYFKKIKEDMEINGKVYYAKLSVKQGTTGYTELPVKADETYTIYIGTLGNSKINAVTFNGEDVTDQVKDGYYTTPAIKAKSVLSISYEDINTTNVKEISNPDLKVTGNEGEISITGVEQPTNVEVYTTDGKLVETRGSVYGDTNIQVKEDNLYLVKVGKRAIKIAM